jgi:hypothetical protein
LHQNTRFFINDKQVIVFIDNLVGREFLFHNKSPLTPEGGTAGASFSAKGRLFDATAKHAQAVPPSGVRGLFE